MEKTLKRLPLGLFCLLSLKFIIWGGGFTDVTALGIIALLAGVIETGLSHGKMKELLSAIANESDLNKERDKKIEDLKAGLTGVKLGQRVNRG